MVARVAMDYVHVNPKTGIDQGLEFRINWPTISALHYFDLIPSYLFLAKYNHV
jgi:hypothetical protein